MGNVGSRLKTIRKDLNLNQKNFADKLSVHYKSVTNYESNTRQIPQEMLIKLFQMGYSVHWLLTGQGNMKMQDYVPEGAFKLEVETDIPVLGETGAGSGGFYDEHNIPMIKQADDFVPRPRYVKDPMAYALRISTINGDSMAPFFKPEEVVIASPMATVVNDDKVIAKLKDGQVMFKIYRCKGEKIELISANPHHKPIVIPATDLVFAHKVVGSWGK
ncbi:MAG: S24 family peptidase [Candidatus Marinimicrobia bacterium]|nr:S24 family peptidase [Candidatus Neomarinimicrobiota bacterium]